VTAAEAVILIIEAILDPDGIVIGARTLRSIPLLDEAALGAVQQWRFTPTLVDGVPRAVMMTVTVNFTLRQ
jgi:periplasmic protein TonB